MPITELTNMNYIAPLVFVTSASIGRARLGARFFRASKFNLFARPKCVQSRAQESLTHRNIRDMYALKDGA